MKKIAFILLACLGLMACSNDELGTEDQTSKVEVSELTEEASEEALTESQEELTEEVLLIEEVEEKTVYVSPQWADAAIKGEVPGYEEVFIGEVSWGEEKDSPYKDRGFIPGSVHINTDLVEEGPVWNFKDVGTIEANLLGLGIDKDTKVLLYGQSPDGVGRIALACLWMGVDDVKIIDGALDTWEASGFETTASLKEPLGKEAFGTEIPARPNLVISMDETKKLLESVDNFRLVSIRSYDEFIGKTSGYSYIPKAGEPEGAVWGLDIGEYTKADGRVLSLDEMTKMWQDKDLDFSLDNDLAFYCGTGWRATVPMLIMYQNGLDNMTLYDGGWNEWQMYEDNPVQVGDPKTEDVIHTWVGDLSDDKAAQ